MSHPIKMLNAKIFATIRFKTILLFLIVLPATLLLYARTAAPSVLSGDSGEFQFAAPLLAVPHPTGYPLYIVLGKLATFLPIGDVAHRVTLVAALAGAGTVTLLGILVLRSTHSLLAALVAAAALAVAPGLWHLSTIAEVYTLNTFLLTLLAVCLQQAWERQGASGTGWLAAAALVTGLGFSNHGSFAFTGVPLFLAFGIAPLFGMVQRETPATSHRPWSTSIQLGGVALLGLTPWLLVVVQYARFGPFDGMDHGLPGAYFWGAPTSWDEALGHVIGGSMRGGVFELPGPRHFYATILTLSERLQFEFGPSGIFLGVVGCYALLRRPLWPWLASAWVAGITFFYFASLGSAVQDAMVFTLPLLLPWAFWIGIGTVALARQIAHVVRNDHQHMPAPHAQQSKQSENRALKPSLHRIVAGSVLTLCLAFTLVWGQTRLPYGNKADQWLFYEFGQGVLTLVEPHAVIMTRWEQGTILYYLHLIEGQRPDVWIDMVEREDEDWLARAARRYPNRTVYIIGNSQDATELDASYVWGTDYATLFELKR